jgi:UDP-hydrolysing UDP-N-acetyl-D-glucosamine 2-epimerase
VRKVCVLIGSRANYGSIKSAMRAIAAHPDLHLQLVVGASALLDRFGSVIDVIEADGFTADAKVAMIVEGETPATMAKSTGLGLIELPTVFDHLRPDVVISVGDRFETMATAVAASYMNIPVAHTMGGEISGTIDESIRHAVTKLAHIHFPANARAAERIVRMGEDPAGSCGRLSARRSGRRDRACQRTPRLRRLAGPRGRRRSHHARRAVPAGQPPPGDNGVR